MDFIIMKCPHCQSEFDLRRSIDVRKETNADRIRSMTDEELSEFILCGCDGRSCIGNIYDNEPVLKQCKQCWLDWLKQEAS